MRKGPEMQLEESLMESPNFPADIVPFIEFLRSIREVQDICMKEELDWSVEYKEKIDKFEMNR